MYAKNPETGELEWHDVAGVQPDPRMANVSDADKQWLAALKSVGSRIEPSWDGNLTVYFEGDDSEEEARVNAEATLRHFLEVVGNIRVQPDHSGHQVPTNPPPK